MSALLSHSKKVWPPPGPSGTVCVEFLCILQHKKKGAGNIYHPSSPLSFDIIQLCSSNCSLLLWIAYYSCIITKSLLWECCGNMHVCNYSGPASKPCLSSGQMRSVTDPRRRHSPLGGCWLPKLSHNTHLQTIELLLVRLFTSNVTSVPLQHRWSIYFGQFPDFFFFFASYCLLFVSKLHLISMQEFRLIHIGTTKDDVWECVCVFTNTSQAYIPDCN